MDHSLDHLPHDLDDGLAARARIGLIVLATDHTIEHEWRLILRRPRRRGAPSGPDLERAADHARDPSADGERSRDDRVGDHARPAAVGPGLRLYLGHHGDRRGRRVRETARGAAGGAAHHADHRGFRRLPRRRCQPAGGADALPARCERVRRAATSRPAATRFRCSGRSARRTITAPRVSRSSRSVTRRSSSVATHGWTPSSWRAPACASPEAVAEIEAAIGKPVTSSNHAMAWHALRLARISDPLRRWGRLFAHAGAS